MRAIKNDPTKNVSSREVVRLKQLVSMWKEKAGAPPGEDLDDVTDVRQVAPAGP